MAAAPAHRDGGLSLCLASAGVVKTLSIAAFTLVWTHSIEKVEWQEDWRITPQGLELVQARVKGSGAGMEPSADARLVDGWFQWRPARRCRNWCLAIPAPPPNSDYAVMEAAEHCRRFLRTRSAPTSRQCACAIRNFC
jgi:hypothetical protein